MVLIPEIPFTLEKVVEKVRERQMRGRNFSIVVVAEGAKPLGGEMVVSRRIEDSPDPIRLGGIGQKISTELEQSFGIESRVTVLGHLQRGEASALTAFWPADTGVCQRWPWKENLE